MGFSGAAPELINGRLAMLGFTAALGAELASGRDVFQQLSGGMPILVIWAAMIFTGASLTPILKNAKRESFLFFTPEREMFNGELAAGMPVVILQQLRTRLHARPPAQRS